MREQLTEYLSIDNKGKYKYFLKSPKEGSRIRRPITEYEGYQLLKPYLRMPRVRLLCNESGPLLIVQGIDAPTSNTLLTTNPNLVKHTLETFIKDMTVMWSDTIRPIDKEKIARDWQTETINTLIRLQNCPTLQPFIDKPIVVNEIRYPSLCQTLQNCLCRLTSVYEDTMMLCHGDEHTSNLLSDNEGYWVIDPGNYTGFNTPSSVINNLVGGLYLFEYEYKGKAYSNDAAFHVDYLIRSDYSAAENLLRPVLHDFARVANTISGGNSLSKELLFINEMRVSVGWINRAKELNTILKIGLIFAGLATEHYYSNEII